MSRPVIGQLSRPVIGQASRPVIGQASRRVRRRPGRQVDGSAGPGVGPGVGLGVGPGVGTAPGSYAGLFPPPPQDRFEVITPDGAALNVERYGPDDAPTVVLVHGWTCSLVVWARQLNALSTGHPEPGPDPDGNPVPDPDDSGPHPGRDSGSVRLDVRGAADPLRLIAYDQRGHGRSSLGPPGSHTAQTLADDLAAVLAAAVPEGRRAVLAGHSMGAMTMIALAARHPELLRTTVAAGLLASTGVHELVMRSRVLPMPLPLARLALPISHRLMGVNAFHDRVTDRLRRQTRYSALSAAATPAEVDFCARLVTACPADTRAAFAPALAALDLDASVADFDVPAVVLSGTADRLTPIWHARRLAAQLPALEEMVEVSGAGHMTPVQAGDAVTRAIRRLVAGHLAAQNPGHPAVQNAGHLAVQGAHSDGAHAVLPRRAPTRR